MSHSPARLILLFLCATILTIIPLPHLLAIIRPSWISLSILYVQFFLPNYFRVYWLVILGFILDTLLSTILGEHLFALCFMTWVANSKTRCFYLFPLTQQMIFVGFFCIIYQSSIFLIDNLLGYPIQISYLLGGSLINILLWPWLCLIGKKFLCNTHTTVWDRRYGEH